MKPIRFLVCGLILVILSLTWGGTDFVALSEPSVPVSSEGAQLLVNPDMELAFASYGAEFRGAPCQVATGWTRFGDIAPRPCWMDARVFAHQVMGTDWVEKVKGQTSQVIVSTEPYVAGIYQRVTGLTPGLPYGFHAGMMTIFQTSAGPPQHGHMIKQVGMDPTGGTDPNAPTVVWSDPQDQDYGWDLRRRTVAYAQANAVTVFARVISEDDPGDWPYVNQSYFDGAILAQTATTSITSPEVSVSNSFVVRWGSVTSVGGELRGYDVQWQDQADGEWHDWLEWDPKVNDLSTEATYSGVRGHSYRFRVRAWQYYADAQNFLYSPWSTTANFTTIAAERLVGRVWGNGPYGLGGTQVAILDTAFETVSRNDGSYQMWTEQMADDHAVTISNPPWLSPEPVYGVTFAPGETVTLDWTLRPPDDAVQNGGFEQDLDGWNAVSEGGVEPETVMIDPVHTGLGAGMLAGQAAVSSTAGVEQTVALARSWNPNLSFWYLADSTDSDDAFDVVLTVVPETAAPLSYAFTPTLDVQGWQHQWYSLGVDDAYFTGTVTISFEVQNDGDEFPTTVFLDEVSVGSTPGGPYRAYFPLVGK